MATNSIPTQISPGSIGIFIDDIDPGPAYSIANASISAAEGFTNSLGNAFSGLGLAGATFDSGSDVSIPTLSIVAKPDIDDVVWTLPAIPADFVQNLNVDGLLPDEFEETAPTLVYPAIPGRDFGTVPEAPGISFEYEEPELEVNLPSVPNLLTLTVRQFDGVTIPTFDEEAPTLTLAPPTVREYTPGDTYASALLTAINSSLTARITDGGTGLDPDVENALWDRAREREAIAKQDAIDQLERMEGMGFSMPSGVYLDARLRVEREHDQNVIGLSREIAIAQAELEQKNVLTALDQAIKLESKQMDMNNAVEQRLFESAKYATEALVTIYNARVNAFGVYTEAYKARIGAYEVQIRAETAKVDAYRAEIAAEEAKAQINLALINQYKVQVDAALANVDIFKARIEGIKVKSEIEKLKVEIFGEQVRAYGTQVNTYSADIEAYRARLQAEATKQDVFKSQVDAYKAQVEAATESIRARVEAYRGKIAGKEIELEKFKTLVDAEESRAKSIADKNSSIVGLYQAESTATGDIARAQVAAWEGAGQLARRDAEIAVAAARVQSDAAVAARQISLDATRAAAQIHAQIGAAALSTLSFSKSNNLTTTANNSYSIANSNSSNWNYNYSESVSV